MIKMVELLRAIAETATQETREPALKLIHAFCMHHANEAPWFREQGNRLIEISEKTETIQEHERRRFIESSHLYVEELLRNENRVIRG